MTRIVAWPRVWARMLPAGKVQRDLADALGDDLRAALQRDVEIGQHDLPRRAADRGAVATTSKVTVETHIGAASRRRSRGHW